MDIKKLGRWVSMLMTCVYVSITIIISGCERNEPEEPKPTNEDVERVTLVYAVNISSLSSDFISDREEMIQGLTAAANPAAHFLLYCTPSDTQSVLYKATPKGDTYEWQEIKSYDRKVTSTDPGRIRQVISDALAIYPDVSKTLIFWGHGSSWTPMFTDHTPRSSIVSGAPSNPSNAYGGEYGQGGTKWIELDELALAVPDGAFDTIWFDCCYMASAEVAYQFRNKCSWLVAYPTEVWQYGLNYDGVIPYLQRAVPDLTGAAQCFFEYYEKNMLPVTVSVMKMQEIQPMAQAVQDIINTFPEAGSVNGVVNYGRNGSRYYDLYQEMRSRCKGDELLMDQLGSALNRFIVYHAESATNFNRSPWIALPLSGISMDHYEGGENESAVYYRTLDWYKRVY